MASDQPTRRRVLEICGHSAIAAAVVPAVGTLLGCPTDPPDETPDDEQEREKRNAAEAGASVRRVPGHPLELAFQVLHALTCRKQVGEGAPGSAQVSALLLKLAGVQRRRLRSP